MVICVDVTPETKEVMDRLISQGRYSSYSVIFTVAVQNLAVLDGSIEKGGALLIGEPAPRHDTQPRIPVPAESGPETQADRSPAQPPFRPRENIYCPPPLISSSDFKAPSQETAEAAVSLEPVPQAFRLPNVPPFPRAYAKPPDDIWVPGQEVPIERWVFGQHNRLLPIKAACRYLANLMQEPILADGIPLASAEKIAEEATKLGARFRKLDALHGLNRDRARVTAFPCPGKGVEKSQARFASQFVGSVNSKGQLLGLPADLKLINFLDPQHNYVLLTQVGWDFAILRNPLFDSESSDVVSKLTEEEQRLLRDHIALSVPVEKFAYLTILQAIKSGYCTPEQIDRALTERFPQADTRSSPSFYSGQRSGVISRMEDLGLVTRVRAGINVSYALTRDGEEIMEALR